MTWILWWVVLETLLVKAGSWLTIHWSPVRSLLICKVIGDQEILICIWHHTLMIKPLIETTKTWATYYRQQAKTHYSMRQTLSWIRMITRLRWIIQGLKMTILTNSKKINKPKYSGFLINNKSSIHKLIHNNIRSAN